MDRLHAVACAVKPTQPWVRPAVLLLLIAGLAVVVLSSGAATAGSSAQRQPLAAAPGQVQPAGASSPWIDPSAQTAAPTGDQPFLVDGTVSPDDSDADTWDLVDVQIITYPGDEEPITQTHAVGVTSKSASYTKSFSGTEWFSGSVALGASLRFSYPSQIKLGDKPTFSAQASGSALPSGVAADSVGRWYAFLEMRNSNWQSPPDGCATWGSDSNSTPMAESAEEVPACWATYSASARRRSTRSLARFASGIRSR